MIHVIATIEVAAGKRPQLLDEFKGLVPTVRDEVGCIEYGPAIDAAAGKDTPAGEPRENVVVMIEKWESLDDLKAHLSAQHMVDFRGRVKEIVAGIQLQILQPA